MYKQFIYYIGFYFICSCASKKDILYVQDVDLRNNTEINYTNSLIQANDVLRINIGALVPESAIPYNKQSGGQGVVNIEMMQLDGYLVSEKLTIIFPNLGVLSAANKTPQEFAVYLAKLLEDGGHLKDPTVDVRLINAKITVLGEVGTPGTFNFTDPNITLLQALGYAGDLTINGIREDVIVIRDDGGVRQITHIDLTTSEWMNGPYNFVRPNDTIIVNQNNPAVKSSGYIPSLTALLGVMTVSLTLVILLTN